MNITHVVGFPPDSFGEDGDFVIDVLNHYLYGPKTDGKWSKEGQDLSGPKGPSGLHIFFQSSSFDEWYRKHWWYGSSTDKKRAFVAWLAAKDFNPTNLQDLEYICELAQRNLQAEDLWSERIARYREILHRLFGEMPG